MPKYLPLKLPPGISRPGTKYDSRGRWYECSLVRWYQGGMHAIHGWRAMQEYDSGFLDLNLGEAARGLFAWKNNTAVPNIAFGTATKCYIYEEGALTDRTPVGFTAGIDTAAVDDVNYGDGLYGAGSYGIGVSLPGSVDEVQSWSFDSFGSYLIACAYSDGKLYSYDPATPAALAQLTNSPTGCVGAVVTPERFVVAIGAGGDLRKLQWADQESLTVWTPAAENQAGSFTITTTGNLVAGLRGKNETLIWTDTDLHAMRYIGGTLVYSVQQVGAACGLISRRAAAAEGGIAFWMGHNGFYLYDGVVRPIPCEVLPFVFDELNRVQVSKITCSLRSSYNEVTWFFPSNEGTENDRYATYNWVEKHWTIGWLARTAMIDAGATRYPIAVAPNGKAYEHEVLGAGFPDHAGGADLVPYAESGPVEVAEGDKVIYVTGYVPDENTLGDTEMTMYMSMYPTAAESSSGPFTASAPTPVRLCGRWVRLRVDQVNLGWKLGTPRIDVVMGGRR